MTRTLKTLLPICVLAAQGLSSNIALWQTGPTLFVAARRYQPSFPVAHWFLLQIGAEFPKMTINGALVSRCGHLLIYMRRPIKANMVAEVESR